MLHNYHFILFLFFLYDFPHFLFSLRYNKFLKVLTVIFVGLYVCYLGYSGFYNWFYCWFCMWSGNYGVGVSCIHWLLVSLNWKKHHLLIFFLIRCEPLADGRFYLEVRQASVIWFYICFCNLGGRTNMVY